MICPVCKIKIDKECWRCGWQAGRCPHCGYPVIIEGKCLACGRRILYLPSPHK